MLIRLFATTADCLIDPKQMRIGLVDRKPRVRDANRFCKIEKCKVDRK